MIKPINFLCKHYAGSLAYGTNLPSSDVDFRGIYCDPPRGIVTPWSKPRSEQWEDPTEEDTVLTELHKYLSGYVDGSPNVLETLWVEESDIIQTSEAYEYLRSQREELLSRKLRWTFGGYALQQMKRIKGHNKWLNNPQEEVAPLRVDYFKLIQNFTSDQVFARDFKIAAYTHNHILVPYGNHIYGVVPSVGSHLFNKDWSIKKVEYKELSDELKKAQPKFIVKLNEEVFKQDHETWKNYWKWRRERNETRSVLEEQHGYDTKHAMHIVRLLRMGREVLEDGIVRVKRPDAEELLAIRSGSWSYEELLEWAEDADNELDKLVKTSPLPPKPSFPKAIETLITAENIANE
ncbi:nucleotidyltransferase [Vibrio phage D69]